MQVRWTRHADCITISTDEKKRKSKEKENGESCCEEGFAQMLSPFFVSKISAGQKMLASCVCNLTAPSPSGDRNQPLCLQLTEQFP